MSNDKGLFERQHHDPDRCCHRHHGTGTRTMASVAVDWGIYPLGALGRADPPAPLYAAGQAPPSASAEGTPAPCRRYRAEHLYGAGA